MGPSGDDAERPRSRFSYLDLRRRWRERAAAMAMNAGTAPPLSLFDAPLPARPGRVRGGVAVEDLLGPLDERERRNAPLRLFFSGDRSLLERGRRVAVVGSRRAGPEDRECARRVTEALVERGIVVVSGLAEGIDTVAHRTAVEQGGRTAAVLGTPLDRVYPLFNADLQGRLAREQLVVSEFPPGVAVSRGGFVMRNRTMALLSDAAVIVAGGARSGARHLGWEALRLGRGLALLEPLARSGLDWVEEQVARGAEPLPPGEIGGWADRVPERPRPDRPAS